MPPTQPAKRTISDATRKKMRIAARRRVQARKNGGANGGTLAARRKELDAASSIIETLSQLQGESRGNVLRLIFGAKSKITLS